MKVEPTVSFVFRLLLFLVDNVVKAEGTEILHSYIEVRGKMADKSEGVARVRVSNSIAK